MLRRTAAAALPEWRDWLTLAAIVALAVGLARTQAPQALLGDWRIASAIGAAAGWFAARIVTRRLEWHRAEGVLAAEALASAPSRRFVAAGLASGIALLIAAGLAARPGALPSLVCGYAGGGLLGLAAFRSNALPAFRGVRQAGGGSATPLRAVAGTQLPFGWSPAGGAVLVAAALATALAAWAAGAWAPAVLAAGTAGPLLLLGRVDHGIVRFLAIAGHDARRSALLHLAATTAYVAPVAASAAALDVRALAVVLPIGTGFACLTTLRVWAYRVRSRRSADAMLSFSVLGAALTGMLLPPLLVPLAGWFAFSLHRRAARATWLLP